MQNLNRNINIGFRVTADERAAIQKNMELCGVKSLRAYLLIMALHGQIIKPDMAEVKECSRLLRSIGNNVNQLAKHANSGGVVFTAALAEVKENLSAVWEQQDRIIKALADKMGAA